MKKTNFRLCRFGKRLALFLGMLGFSALISAQVLAAGPAEPVPPAIEAARLWTHTALFVLAAVAAYIVIAVKKKRET